MLCSCSRSSGIAFSACSEAGQVILLKNLGILDTALESISFNQKAFMELDPFRGMDRVGRDFEQLRSD